jgi:hypothetical protein
MVRYAGTARKGVLPVILGGGAESAHGNALTARHRTPTVLCETPLQSLVAAAVGGLVGGVAALSLGFGPVGVAALAGVLGGAGDLAAHAARRDREFEEAVSRLRG